MSLQFSVLLSLYYKESPTALYQSLVSIFKQTLLPDEIVLVKDGPLTNELENVLEEFLCKFSILKIVSLSQNQGLGRALNEGLKYCTYDLIARMDTDDVAKPDRFEKQLIVFERNSNIDVCSAWIDEFESDISNIIPTRKVPERHWEIFHFAQSRCPVNHPVVMFKKSAIVAVGGYKHFPLFEDYYLWVRLLMNGANFYNIQESLLFFRASTGMFKRRGGWRYALDEVRFQRCILKMGFISQLRFAINVLTRFPIRIAPNSLRGFIYKKSLR